MASERRPRIFWLGMHKILRSTELPQLREMGFEVFSPEYVSPIYDQSADLAAQHDQPTTLPPDVFRRLLAYDFFYRPIEPEIAALLNAHFDAAIVTINPDWLLAMLDAFAGPVIYRIYGQPYPLSHHFVANGRWDTLVTREHLHVVPFAAESVEREQRWFRALCTEPVPYQIPDDVFELAAAPASSIRPEIAVSIPNISNPYYGHVYHDFVSDFPEPTFRIYGPQREIPADPRVLGELDRGRFLDGLRHSAGYLYPYQDDVCYLPPIEAMQLGRPVVYLPDSLLARFSRDDNPGAARSIEQARTLCQRLVEGDAALANEIVAAQEQVRRRYDRALVRPQFERVMRGLLERSLRPAAARFDGALLGHGASGRSAGRLVVLPLHVDGLFHYIDGQPVALEGIPRVVEALVETLVSHADVHVLLSCTHGAQAVMFDFFREHIDRGRVSLFPFSAASTSSPAAFNFEKLRFVDHLAANLLRIAAVLVPHYYLFPEMSLVHASQTLYLPDYFPHLMPDTVFDGSAEKDRANKAVGRMLARRAERILTNSQFTKDYLPDTGLVEAADTDKIIVAPLPFLGGKRAGSLGSRGRARIEEGVRGREFLFYPTANRPNKKLAFFLRLLAHVRLDRPELCAVLTCDLGSVTEVADAARDYQLADALVMLPGSTEDMMRWLFENTAALCLTSVAEGNFPPQVLEALNYGAPVIATRLPTIAEIARDEVDRLLLCDPLDLTGFARAVDTAIERRDEVLARQSSLLASLRRWNSPEAFAASLARALPHVEFKEAGDRNRWTLSGEREAL